ncbi:MAG: membrane protein insertase YidC [Gammaproteobacteria bacterium]
MDIRRITLYGLLFFIISLLWLSWVKEHAISPVQQKARTEQSINTNDPLASALQEHNRVDLAPEETALANDDITKTKVPASSIIKVRTDLLDISIDTLGGNVINASLLNYKQKLHDKTPFELLSHNIPYVAESGLLSKRGPDNTKQQARFSSEQENYVLPTNQDTLNVVLHWNDSQGLRVDKIFTFHRGRYAMDVSYKINNQSASAWQGNVYNQLIRKPIEHKQPGLFSIASYDGAAISSPDKPYQKISFKTMRRDAVNQTITDGWLAMQQHYFISAWVPAVGQAFNYFSRQLANDTYAIGMVGPKTVVAPGNTQTLTSKLYLGPELTEQLEQTAPHLNLTIDYGWLWFISVAIFWLMQHIHNIVGNWGWSIVLVTLFIKLAFYKLSATSYRSMANMRKLQPRIETLKQRYGDDRQRMGQAMMELYKKEKINPLGGCLPILIQIPVFIALYWVLVESVELRHAPFIGWIHDLSAPDPYYVLPILMGISMFIQQRLSPAPPDPMQAKVMMMLPLIFTFLFLYFPSGLVLYWVVNNTLSILQQWVITRKINASPVPNKA